MATFANINVAQIPAGVSYCTNKIIPAVEGDLFNLTGLDNPPDPISIRYQEALFATIQLTNIGGVSVSNAYVILQTDNGDGNWIDVAGIVTSSNANALYALSAGIAGALTLQQTRAAGTAPGANFSNQITLGHRLRFVGKAATSSASSSSSSSSGSLPPGFYCSIQYKLLGLR